MGRGGGWWGDGESSLGGIVAGCYDCDAVAAAVINLLVLRAMSQPPPVLLGVTINS